MNKFQQITAVFNEEISTVTQNQNSWTAFLKTAANNYKYNFVEQILIHAQRPDATACAEIEVWNEKFGRWVNRGARGIALFDYSGSYQKLRYVFDVSDTNSFYGNEVELWTVPERYDNQIIEALGNAFGEVGEGSLASVIDDTAINMAEDNAADYLEMITDIKLGSFLEELDSLNIEAVFKSALSNSVGYMLMTRCGIDADTFYDSSDFRDVMNFNTSSLAISLGTAVSEIAEMGLREIESTVRNLQKSERKHNRTFDKSKENVYDEVTNTERSNDNGTDSIQTSRRLPNPKHHNAETGEQTARQIRHDEKDIPAKTQESALEHSVDQRRTDEPSSRNSGAGSDNGTADNREADERIRSDGTAQGIRPDEMGSDDEQYSELGTGNRTQRSDLQLSGHDFDARGNGIEYFHQNKEKNELIKTYLAPYKDEIAAFFEVHSDRDERSDFVMSFFDSKPFEMTLSNGIKAGLEAYEDAIYFWRTDKNAPSHECWERWFQIRDSVYGMILLEQWTEPQALLLPSVDNQIGFLAAKSKNNNLHLPQAAIDYILCRGSGVSEGKMRIYHQFTESLSKDDNIRFLKNEYGMGGHSDAIPGSGYWENHDAKGISIEDWHGEPKRKILLPWQQVEKRIAELIKVDRYLNSKEKEIYPKWLEKQEELEFERAEEKRSREILQTVSPEPKVYEYQYHLGDTVYIGADEYTITSLSDPVILNDSKFPLFSTEMSRAEFEQKVKENPANDHLKVVVTKEPVIEKQISDNPIWNEYKNIKAENPDSIVFYQLGDFFEIMGEDANTVAEALDVVLTSRKVSDNEKIPMCGIPSHRLETYLGMMNDRGYDVTLSTFENGKRQNRLIVSQNKEEPVESKPIGRINYLHTDGNVRESIEYTSEYKLKKDIQEENFYGVPMTVTLYRDKSGKVVPHKYISELDPPIQGFAIIDSPYILPPEEEINDNDLVGKEVTIDDRKYVIESVGKISGDVSMRDVTFQNGTGFPINRVEKIDFVRTHLMKEDNHLEEAKRLIKEYCDIEFGDCDDFSDLSRVSLGYTTVTEDEIPIYAYVDLVNFKLERQLNDTVIETRQCYSLPDLIINELESLEFSDLMYVSDEDLAKYNETTTITPAWEEYPKQTSKPTIPESEKLNYKITDDNLGIGGAKEKFRNNMAAINLLHDLEFENRLATPGEQEILAKYVGFGGLDEAFDATKDNWKTEFTELYTALSPEEYTAARESTLTAFYTPPVVIRSIYRALENMGFTTGNILELLAASETLWVCCPTA